MQHFTGIKRYRHINTLTEHSVQYITDHWTLMSLSLFHSLIFILCPFGTQTRNLIVLSYTESFELSGIQRLVQTWLPVSRTVILLLSYVSKPVIFSPGAERSCLHIWNVFPAHTFKWLAHHHTWWPADHLNKLCLSGDTSQTCKTGGPKHEAWLGTICSDCSPAMNWPSVCGCTVSLTAP